MIEYVYIHIPFCIRKCHYCSFVSGFDIKDKEQYLNALLKQIKEEYKEDKIKTLYIGGGTPSLLDSKDIEKIVSKFNFQNNPEITLEANPETVTTTNFKEFKHIGINRISLGVQTFNNDILKLIGRNHNNSEIYTAIDNIRNADIKNLNIDLIYGIPNQTAEVFQEDLTNAISLNIEHISSYGLKIEEGSYFYKNSPKNIPNEELQAEMYHNMCNILIKNGFQHYEISNFAKSGFESKHNCAYWRNKNYYGFGLNASGYIGNNRYRNSSDLKEYFNNPLKKEEEYNISEQETIENEIFLALRLKEGLNTNNLNKKYNINFEKKYKKVLQKYTDLNLLQMNNGICSLTREGILLSNSIMAEFIETY